jgi:hypothetical protein
MFGHQERIPSSLPRPDLLCLCILARVKVFVYILRIRPDKTDDELFETALGMDKLPNPEFIYHNKLPKCGSTTMHAILGVLSRWNSFRYLKLEPSLVKFFDGEKMSKLITTLVENKKVSKERSMRSEKIGR